MITKTNIEESIMSAQQGKDLAKKMLEGKTENNVESWFTSREEEAAYNAVLQAKEAVAQAQDALIKATRALEQAQQKLEEDKFVYETESWIAGV